MADIFISYATSDRERARTLADRLAARGYSVWWDRTIPPGRVFDEVIQEALHAAKCVIVLWSAQSVKSNWVKTEAAEGMSVERLVPALIERVQPPIEFKRIQAADLSDWSGDDDHPEYRKLLASTDDMLRRPLGKDADYTTSIALENQPYRPPRSRSGLQWMVGGVVVLLAAAAAGGYVLGKRENSLGPADTASVGSAPPQPAGSIGPTAAATSDKSSVALAATPSKTGRINLLAGENGGEIVIASNERWAATIDGKEDTYAWVDNGQAVFAFKDGRAATFDTFAVLIPGTNDNNLAEFELLAGNDGPQGSFTPLGTFRTQNVRIMKQPYQEFHFAPVTAKFLKFRSLKASNGQSGAVTGYELQLLGRLE